MGKTMNETPTGEEQEQQLLARQEAMQEKAMADILEAVEALNWRANRADYEPTVKEREDFGKIYTIITNMDRWF